MNVSDYHYILYVNKILACNTSIWTQRGDLYIRRLIYKSDDERNHLELLNSHRDDLKIN